MRPTRTAKAQQDHIEHEHIVKGLCQIFPMPPQLLRSPIFLFRRILAVAQQIALRTQSAPFSAQYALLYVLSESQHSYQQNLADCFGQHKSDITKLLNRLVREKLVSRQRSETDKRQSMITLTPLGHKRVAEISSQKQRITRELFGNLSERQMQQLCTLCRLTLARHDERFAPSKPRRAVHPGQ